MIVFLLLLFPPISFAKQVATSVESQQVQNFNLESLPEVTFTILHSESNQEGPSCAFKINNASIVTKIEIGSMKFLFMGDANGKNREDFPDIVPKYVEKKLLDLVSPNPDILKLMYSKSLTMEVKQQVPDNL